MAARGREARHEDCLNKTMEDVEQGRTGED